MCHYNHLTLVEREKIMYFHAQKYSISAIARELHRSKSTISRWQGQPAQSITPDRGKEFAKHAEVTEALDGVKFNFLQPHQP